MSEDPDFDVAVLFILAYELSPSEKSETDAKIRRKLQSGKLGEFDERRIERLRRFKDEIQAEIHKGPQSRYYTHAHGKHFDGGQFADHRDFDKHRMASDFAESFPELRKESIQYFVDYAIFIYYLK